MRAKTLILFIITLLAAKSLSAQLRFDRLTHNFGTIAEAGGKVSCTFTATNEGTRPVVILDIVTTCGCTVPTFSRKPIRAGEQTTIEVSFDPYGRAGVIDRKLHLYDDKRNRIATLTLTGEVSPRTRTVEERYPIEAAEGIRLSATMATFNYIYVGAPIRSAISLINTSDQPHRIELRPTVQSGLLEVEAPATLAAGERSAINFSYHNTVERPQYGTIRDAMELWIDGKRANLKLITHGFGVDRATKSTKDAPPMVEVSENILKFGAVKAAAQPIRRPFAIRNVGHSRLILRKIEGKRLTTTFVENTPIEAGETLTGEVIFDPAKADYGFFTEQLLLITNEPERPVRRVRVTAVVEE